MEFLTETLVTEKAHRGFQKLIESFRNAKIYIIFNMIQLNWLEIKKMGLTLATKLHANNIRQCRLPSSFYYEKATLRNARLSRVGHQLSVFLEDDPSTLSHQKEGTLNRGLANTVRRLGLRP